MTAIPRRPLITAARGRSCRSVIEPLGILAVAGG